MCKSPKLPAVPPPAPPPPEKVAKAASVNSEVQAKRKQAARLGTSQLQIPLTVNVPK